MTHLWLGCLQVRAGARWAKVQHALWVDCGELSEALGIAEITEWKSVLWKSVSLGVIFTGLTVINVGGGEDRRCRSLKVEVGCICAVWN